MPGEVLGLHLGQADLYVVATQESCPVSELERMLQAHLPPKRFVRVAAESLLSINLLVYARASLAPRLRDVRTSAVATGGWRLGWATTVAARTVPLACEGAGGGRAEGGRARARRGRAHARSRPRLPPARARPARRSPPHAQAWAT